MNNARLKQQPFLRVVQRPNPYGEEYPVPGTDWFSIAVAVGIAVAIITGVLIW